MNYINDPKQPHITYDDAVAIAIKSGIEPKRAYIYLAGLGIKGELYRVMGDPYYSRPVKLAVMNDKYIVKMSICANCKGLKVN